MVWLSLVLIYLVLGFALSKGEREEGFSWIPQTVVILFWLPILLLVVVIVLMMKIKV